VNQYVGAFRHFRHRFERYNVAGKCNRSVLEVEAIGQRWLHWRMLDKDHRHLSVVVLRYRTGSGDFPDVDCVSGFIW
jgi:hypothetical protein